MRLNNSTQAIFQIHIGEVALRPKETGCLKIYIKPLRVGYLRFESVDYTLMGIDARFDFRSLDKGNFCLFEVKEKIGRLEISIPSYNKKLVYGGVQNYVAILKNDGEMPITDLYVFSSDSTLLNVKRSDVIPRIEPGSSSYLEYFLRGLTLGISSIALTFIYQSEGFWRIKVCFFDVEVDKYLKIDFGKERIGQDEYLLWIDLIYESSIGVMHQNCRYLKVFVISNEYEEINGEIYANQRGSNDEGIIFFKLRRKPNGLSKTSITEFSIENPHLVPENKYSPISSENIEFLTKRDIRKFNSIAPTHALQEQQTHIFLSWCYDDVYPVLNSIFDLSLNTLSNIRWNGLGVSETIEYSADCARSICHCFVNNDALEVPITYTIDVKGLHRDTPRKIEVRLLNSFEQVGINGQIERNFIKHEDWSLFNWVGKSEWVIDIQNKSYIEISGIIQIYSHGFYNINKLHFIDNKTRHSFRNISQQNLGIVEVICNN